MSALVLVLSMVLVAVVAGPAPVRRLRRSSGRGRATVAVDRRAVRRLQVGVAAAVGLVLRGPDLALALGGAALLLPVVVGEVRRRRQAAVIAAAVPDLVELFLVAASAGRSVPSSLEVVAARAPRGVGAAVGQARDRFAHGLPLADCLAELGRDLGAGAAPLVDALGQSAAAGVPLVPLLEGVAATARDARRRRAQAAARRLPVALLFPLVLCVLPAALLLAVVPVLVVSVASLDP